jgi:hypothetical protein
MSIMPLEGFDASKEESISATVVDVAVSFKRPAGFITLTVTVDGARYCLPVSHVDLLNSNGLSFSPGDEIIIEGMKITDEQIIIAREITKGANTLVLRGEDGHPVAELHRKLNRTAKSGAAGYHDWKYKYDPKPKWYYPLPTGNTDPKASRGVWNRTVNRDMYR